MKKLAVFLVLSLCLSAANAQPYVPFPTDSARWSVTRIITSSPNPAFWPVEHFDYFLDGDTVIGNQSYAKLYITPNIFLGGLREDSLKNIYGWFILGNSIYTGMNMPDTTEVLLYSFNNLQVGDTLPINPSSNLLVVNNIDSVLVGTQYRKVYEIFNSACGIGGPDYWIEGIGSSMFLFSPYHLQFENYEHTRCYDDNSVHFVNPYNFTIELYHDPVGCYYDYIMTVPGTVTTDAMVSVYPNPAAAEVQVGLPPGSKGNHTLRLCDLSGRTVLNVSLTAEKSTIDLRRLAPGTYLLEIRNDDQVISRRKLLHGD